MDYATQDERVALLKTSLRAQAAAGLFNMIYWRQDATDLAAPEGTIAPDCGSICCIGGTIDAINNPDPNSEAAREWGWYHSTEWLGLDLDTGHRLFYPPDEVNWGKIGVELAIEAIDIAVALSRRPTPDCYVMRDFWLDRLESDNFYTDDEADHDDDDWGD